MGTSISTLSGMKKSGIERKKDEKRTFGFRTHRFSSVWILLGSGFNFLGLVFGMLILPISLVKILKFRPQVHETGSRYNQLD
jgi:hypothetical protein